MGRSDMVLLQSPISANPADLSVGYYFLSFFLSFLSRIYVYILLDI
jgi:hypothetical protein